MITITPIEHFFLNHFRVTNFQQLIYVTRKIISKPELCIKINDIKYTKKKSLTLKVSKQTKKFNIYDIQLKI